MRVKEFLRELCGFNLPDAPEIWVAHYCREKLYPVAFFPVGDFGVNASGQLVLARDWSMTKIAYTLSELKNFLTHVSPELLMYVADDCAGVKDYSDSLELVDLNLFDSKFVLTVASRAEANEKFIFERNEAVKKYNL